MHSIPHDTSGVNSGLGSDRDAFPRIGRMMLSEDECLCDVCGERIEGLAGFVQGAPDPGRWNDSGLLGLSHEDCLDTLVQRLAPGLGCPNREIR